MDLGIKLGDLLAALAGSLFAFWPFLVLAPITWERRSFPRIARAMLIIWVVAAAAGLAAYLARFPHFSIIREPANSLLFIGAGVALLAANLATRSKL